MGEPNQNQTQEFGHHSPIGISIRLRRHTYKVLRVMVVVYGRIKRYSSRKEIRIIFQDHNCYANSRLHVPIRHRKRLCGDQHVRQREFVISSPSLVFLSFGVFCYLEPGNNHILARRAYLHLSLSLSHHPLE